MKFFSEIDSSLKGYLIFLDIDGTLTVNHSSHIAPETLQVLSRLKKNNTIYLCSNGTRKDRNRKLAETYGIHYLDTPLTKPNKDLLKLAKNPKKQPLLVIGNLNFTDGRFAKNIGARFIKVKTLIGPDESWWDRLEYMIDEHIIARLI